MAMLPTFDYEYSEREITDTFGGYHRARKIGAGEFYDTENLSSAEYPLLSNRKKRGLVRRLSAPGGMLAKEKLAYVEGGTLYYDDAPTPLSGLAPGKKQLVSMGATLVVFPDRCYYNTADPGDCGSLDAVYRSTGAVEYALCAEDGTRWERPLRSDAPPETPGDGQLWMDTAASPPRLKRYAAAEGIWEALTTVYTRVQFISEGELPALFRQYDGVTISGGDEAVGGEKILQAVGGGEGELDYLVVAGLYTGEGEQTQGSVCIERRAPEMDYVIECRNRLWGCRYGGGLNEIYCCALGDFRNWRQYQGLSTDSWTASVGSDGPWTGAVNYFGYPLFFKENRIHRVTVSASGAHALSETVCRGVQSGCSESLQVVNETLLYKSRADVCAYQGGFPRSVSEHLGEGNWSEAAAGCIGERYYLSMKNEQGAWSLFVYDLRRELWMREDSLCVRRFAALGDELYAMTDESLLALLGSRGEKEPYVPWMAETGMLYYQQPERKYVSRFQLRLWMEEGASLEVYVMYDSDGQWVRQGRIRMKGTRSVTLPVRPRRCDHLRIRLVGRGEARLYSVAKILTLGSDVG